MSAFEAYAKLANENLTNTQLAGRYQSQAEAERLIFQDVADKLRLRPTDTFLDIGCGPGNLLTPASYACKSATGMDNPKVIERLQRTMREANVALEHGPFPEMRPSATYDCILAYSVVHYMTGIEEIERFVLAALECLRPGGRLLVGDIPNADRKARFLASRSGQMFEKRWRESVSATQTDTHLEAALRGFNMIGALSDADILRLVSVVRRRGFDAYVLPQPPDLPFGNTREDILAVQAD